MFKNIDDLLKTELNGKRDFLLSLRTGLSQGIELPL